MESSVWKKSVAVLILALGCLPAALWAHDMASMPGKKVPAEFEKLKDLVGTWTGKDKMDGKEMPFTVTYQLTGGGSALLEQMFKGTPHEMMSVYYCQGDKVMMTHYCMLGNHPEMTLVKSDRKSQTFEMTGTNGLSDAKEAHMHGVKITWTDKDHIRTDWTGYADGKVSGCNTLKLTRMN